MPTEKKLTPYEVTKILNWGKRWKALKSRQWMADKYGVSETTIKRIVENGGYVPRKARASVDELAKLSEPFSTVPRETEVVQ